MDQTDTVVVWPAFFPLAKKENDKMQGCLGLTSINLYLRCERCKVESLHTVQPGLRRTDYMRKVAMSDFYMQLLIAEEDHLYFRFLFDGVKSECTAMPFGLGLARRTATKLWLSAVQCLRRWQVRCMAYVDAVCGMAR